MSDGFTESRDFVNVIEGARTKSDDYLSKFDDLIVEVLSEKSSHVKFAVFSKLTLRSVDQLEIVTSRMRGVLGDEVLAYISDLLLEDVKNVK